MIEILNKLEIDKMRRACKLAAEILEATASKIKMGISTGELNDYALELATKAGAIMAPYKYKINPTDVPFPKHICTSINNVVCHGIPKDNEYLKKGDIINLDITVILNGFHGDTSKTVFVGDTTLANKKLIEITEKALYVGISEMYSGNCISNIGLAIEKFIKPYKYGIVEELCGHGVNKKFHTEPSVFHFYNPKYKFKLRPNITLSCEPMINAGSKKIKLLNDGWTIVTADGKASAQFEHTILIAEQGNEILTKI